MTSHLMDERLINLGDFEKKAKKLLPTEVYDYYASGACDEITLQQNRQSYQRLNLVPRILADISQRNLSISLFGQELSMPILIAPTSYHGMANIDGELATARAANTKKTVMVASTMANTTLEDIATEHTAAWFQVYLLNDRQKTIDLVQRAERSQYKAIVLTVDSQVLGIREADLQNKFTLPPHLQLKNFPDYGIQKTQAGSQELFDKKLSWKDIEWLRSITRLPILIKGILHKTDAKIAVDLGINGVIVSNHGGRQLDTAIPSIDALPEIVKVVDKKIPILIDGGIRRGTDVLKALALGANAVLIGRPVLWGLAVEGSAGVEKVLDIIKNEFDTAMALCGFSSIEEIINNGKDIIYKQHH